MSVLFIGCTGTVFEAISLDNNDTMDSKSETEETDSHPLDSEGGLDAGSAVTLDFSLLG